MIRREQNFYLVFTEMQIYGPRHESRTVAWAKCQIFLETLFICNNIDKNLNENFHSYSQTIFIFSNLCDNEFKKIRKRKMDQGRVPSPTISSKNFRGSHHVVDSSIPRNAAPVIRNRSCSNLWFIIIGDEKKKLVFHFRFNEVPSDHVPMRVNDTCLPVLHAWNRAARGFYKVFNFHVMFFRSARLLLSPAYTFAIFHVPTGNIL